MSISSVVSCEPLDGTEGFPKLRPRSRNSRRPMRSIHSRFCALCRDDTFRALAVSLWLTELTINVT